MTNTENNIEWRGLIDRAVSLADNVNTAAYLQLATFDDDRGAQVRTLVFRGFSDNSDRLFMATDLRSDKVKQVITDNRVQVAWYFSEAREQYRLSGTMACLGPSAVDQEPRRALWNAMSLSVRASFFCDAMGQEPKDAKELAASATPPDYFALLSMTISEVELLSLAQSPHMRRRFWLGDNGWENERIAL